MTDSNTVSAGLRAATEREYYRERARVMAGEIVELQAERRGQAAELMSLGLERDALAAEVARLTAGRTGAESERARLREAVAALADRVAELEGIPVLEIIDAAVGYGAAVLPGIPAQLMRHLGPVTLPAQDRAEELAAAFMNERAARGKFMTWAELTDADRAKMTDAARVALASLGAPPTSPTVAPIDADALYARCEADFMGGYSGQLYDAFKHGMWTVCNVLRSTKPTSPPAARPVFAGVSVEELVVQYLMAGDPGLDPGVARSMVSGPRRAGVAAVLARLKVTLVAEADPEAVALRLRDHAREIGLHPQREPADYLDSLARLVRVIFRAAGVPVTPERGK